MTNTLKSILFFTFLFASSHSYSANINPGDLLVSEVMSNPAQVSDTAGEWFEIFNASANIIDLDGITISDNGSNAHEIDNGGSLLIDPGTYLVLGRNADMSQNGGYLADYVYSNFTLGNSQDQIILSRDNIEIARLDYSGAAFGVAGVSSELIAQTLMPTISDYMLTENFIYGLGDIGTPGGPGSFALTSASPVPIPGAIWFLMSGVLLLARSTKFRNSSACNKINPIREYSC